MSAGILFMAVTRHTPAAVITNKNKKGLDPLRAMKTFIRKKEDEPYRSFGYLSLISYPIRSGKRSQRKILLIGNV